MRGGFDSSRSLSTPLSRSDMQGKASSTSFQGVALITVPIPSTEGRETLFAGPFYGFQVIEASSNLPESSSIRLKCGKIKRSIGLASNVDPQSVRCAVGMGIAHYGYGSPEDDAPFDWLEVQWPAGLTGPGNFTVMIHLRPPTQNLIQAATLLDRFGAPVSSNNPLPVSTAQSLPAELSMAVPAGVVVGAADTQIIAANASRRALWVGMSLSVPTGCRLSLAFGGAPAVLDSGITFYQHADAANRGGLGPNFVRICSPPEAPFRGEVRGIGSAAGVKGIAQEAN